MARPIHLNLTRLLDPHALPDAQRKAANELFDLLATLVGLDENSPSPADLRDTWLEGGHAIAPLEAARCLREHARTAKFLQATRAAVDEARNRFPGETIRVLYAGCGPFAPLAVLLAHLWPVSQVRFTLLDVHETSLKAAKLIAHFLGVHDRMEAFIRADAGKYRCPEPLRPHLLVTETMQQALRDETQVSICRNLVPQLAGGGLLVPERVELLASLIDTRINFSQAPDENKQRIDLGRIMRLDRETASKGGECSQLTWPSVIPKHMEPFVRTRIQVFQDLVLDDDCSLNLPMALPMPSDGCQGGKLHFRYQLTPRPGLSSSWTYNPSEAPHPAPTGNDRYLRLPLNFDPQPLQQELARLLRHFWPLHPNKADYDGNWRALALRSPSGREEDNCPASGDPTDYRDTPALRSSPNLADVLDALPGRICSARLLSLAAGAVIATHRDRGLRLWDGLVRLHVPLLTNEAVEFRLAGERLIMCPGECWYINADYPHGVTNGGSTPRIHLVVDCLVDNALADLFLSLGHPSRPIHPFGDPALTPDNIHQVIEQLEAMGTPTARRLAWELTKKARKLDVIS